jgi:hypothetical protein
MAPNMHLHMGDSAMLQQLGSSTSSAAAVTAAMHSLSGPLLMQQPVSAAAAAAAAAAGAAVPFYRTSCLWPNKHERESGLFFSAEHAYDNSACSGSFASAPIAAAACASHSSDPLPQQSCSNNSGALPSLLEVIPAMSWLQLEQQGVLSAAAAAAAAAGRGGAGDPAGLRSVPFATSSNHTNAAATPARAAQAASIQEVTLTLNAQAANVLLGSLDFVERYSGAGVRVVADSTGCQLRLCGSSSQIETGCGYLRMLLV